LTHNCFTLRSISTTTHWTGGGTNFDIVKNSKTLPFVEIKLDGGEWFASRTGPFTAAERDAQITAGGWVDPRASLYTVLER